MYNVKVGDLISFHSYESGATGFAHYSVWSSRPDGNTIMFYSQFHGPNFSFVRPHDLFIILAIER